MNVKLFGIVGTFLIGSSLALSACTKKQEGDEFLKGKGSVPEAALSLTPEMGQYHSTVKLRLDPLYHFNLKAPKNVVRKNGAPVPEEYTSVVTLQEKEGEVIFPTRPGQLGQKGMCPLVLQVFVCDEKETFCERVERELPCL
jgi:hypothetical protein